MAEWSDSKRGEFIDKCYQVCEQAGDKLPELLIDTSSGFIWEVHNYEQVYRMGTDEELAEAKKTLMENCADMYIALMAAIAFYHLDTNEMDKRVDQQLGITS